MFFKRPTRSSETQTSLLTTSSETQTDPLEPDVVRPTTARMLEMAASEKDVTLYLNPFDDFETVDAAATAITTNGDLQSLTIEFDPPRHSWKGIIYNGPLHKALQRNTSILRLNIVGSRTPESWKSFVLRNNCLRIPPPASPPANDGANDGGDNPLDGCEPAGDRFTSLGPDDRIGGGAEGAVFRIEIDGVTVAAKTPFALQNPALYGLLDRDTGLESRATVYRACMREVDALRRLDGHPNIVKFHSVRTTTLEGMVMPTWICMHLEDRTLHRRIYDGSCDFDADVRGILAGLEYLHSLGMMHRDIKPENILIALDGTVKLGDLGFAKVMHLLSRRRAAAHTALGTPAYLAPEASNEDGVYDLSRDIYAFGVMIVEMLLVEAPEATHDLRRPQFLRAAEASPDVAWLVERCTATDPASRPSSRALKQWFESVHLNDTTINHNLNVALSILNHGVGPYPLCEEAVRLLRSTADRGNPDAMCELGVCVFYGRGVHTNEVEAKALWREAADRGSVEAPGHLAVEDIDYRRSVDTALVDAAVARWRERAVQSHADAQRYLGHCFWSGVGVATDEAEAVQWYRRSADQGCAMAQSNLGWCYTTGTGVAQDKGEGGRLYRLAADQGHAPAQASLGHYHEHGLGGVAKDPAEAARLYRLSADHGDSDGQCFLGECYKNGVGVEKDLAEAKRLLTLSAEQGSPDAQSLLQSL